MERIRLNAQCLWRRTRVPSPPNVLFLMKSLDFHSGQHCAQFQDSKLVPKLLPSYRTMQTRSTNQTLDEPSSILRWQRHEPKQNKINVLPRLLFIYWMKPTFQSSSTFQLLLSSSSQTLILTQFVQGSMKLSQTIDGTHR